MRGTKKRSKFIKVIDIIKFLSILGGYSTISFNGEEAPIVMRHWPKGKNETNTKKPTR